MRLFFQNFQKVTLPISISISSEKGFYQLSFSEIQSFFYSWEVGTYSVEIYWLWEVRFRSYFFDPVYQLIFCKLFDSASISLVNNVNFIQ